MEAQSNMKKLLETIKAETSYQAGTKVLDHAFAAIKAPVLYTAGATTTIVTETIKAPVALVGLGAKGVAFISEAIMPEKVVEAPSEEPKKKAARARKAATTAKVAAAA